MDAVRFAAQQAFGQPCPTPGPEYARETDASGKQGQGKSEDWFGTTIHIMMRNMYSNIVIFNIIGNIATFNTIGTYLMAIPTPPMKKLAEA